MMVNKDYQYNNYREHWI